MDSPRTIAIGDIHGCSTALKVLIEQLDLRPHDTVITLGDHVDWGPDSHGVIAQLLDLDQRCRRISLLGNHELMLMDALQGRMSLAGWMEVGGDTTAASYGRCEAWEDLPAAHGQFFDSCLPFFECESAIFVHANYAPNRTVSQQSSYDLYWRPLEAAEAAPHYCGKPVLCGHTPQTSGEILDLGFLVCLDTDCSRGGWLTALEVSSGHLWQANEAGFVRQSRRLRF